MPSVSDERLMSAQEVADYLGIPITTLYAWRYKGEGPPGYRVGRHIRHRREQIDRWLEDHADDRTER